MWIVKWPCLFSVFQFLLECRFKELVVDVSRSTDSLPPPSPGFSSRGVICYRTTGTSLRVSVWIIFFSLYSFALFSVSQAFTLTKLLLCEPTVHRVTFLLARRQILGILRMQMQLSFLLYAKRALPPYIINLSVLFAHWSYFCMSMCVEMK